MRQLVVVGYDVMELLGTGGSAEVWLGRDLSSGDLVALKRVRPDRPDLAGSGQLRHEATALDAVRHPGLLRLRAMACAVGGEPVMVLDYAAGGSLSALLASRARLSPGEVVTVGAALSDALDSIHARGLVHGDVTPGNVLFTADGRPLLGDPGFFGDNSDHRERVVTPGFTDAAVVAGASPGASADVHGLAATCFAAMTGRVPYDETGRRVACSAGVRAAAGPLVPVLEQGLSSDLSVRPSLPEFAAALRSSVPATSIRLTRTSGDQDSPELGWPGDFLAPGHPAALTHRPRLPRARPAILAAQGLEPRRRVGRRRAPRSRASVRQLTQRVTATRCGVALAALVVLGSAGIAGSAWAGGQAVPSYRAAPRQAAPRQAAPRQAVDERAVVARARPTAPAADVSGALGWQGVVEALDARRSEAYATGSRSMLARVYAPGSPAWRLDSRRLGRLNESGLQVDKLRYDVQSVTLLAASRERAVLRLGDRLEPYTLGRPGAAGVTARPGRGPANWRLSLRRADGEWRVYDVVRLS